jgi:hypothetical protein
LTKLRQKKGGLIYEKEKKKKKGKCQTSSSILSGMIDALGNPWRKPELQGLNTFLVRFKRFQ